MITQYNISHIYRSNSASEYKRKIWDTLSKRYSMIQFNQVDTHSLFDKSQLPFTLDKLPDSFSKFRRMVSDISVRAPLGNTTPATKQQLNELNRIGKRLESRLERSSHSTHNSAKVSYLREALGPASNIYAATFKVRSASSYKETRNGLDGLMDYSTKFSPWLSNGSISARQIIERPATVRNRRLKPMSPPTGSTLSFCGESIFNGMPRAIRGKLFKFNGIKNTNPTTSFYPERFQKWCQGNTPYPIVNACMKQLNATGYMSNRGRQLVASCFVHELNLDWRYGAAYMEQQLIDYDVASNWGNWQYLAGVGADPRGHRRFDLEKQTQIYDPDRLFIKRWGGDQHLEQLDSRDTVDWPI